MRGAIGLIVILGLLLIVGMILAGLRGANALLKPTQAAQEEALERHRAGLAQLDEGAALQRGAVELARRSTAASEAAARTAAEIYALLAARIPEKPPS